MTASKTNHWKLGLFVTSGILLGLIALLWIGKAKFGGEIVQRTAFFTESVTGLEVGSPVKIRGVTIGSVSAIRFAQDGRSVEVVLDGYVDTMERLGLLRDDETDSDDVYAQLGSAGITGAKYILMDFVEPGNEPEYCQFDFPLPPGHIRTVPSSLENLENLLVSVAKTIPPTLDDLRATSHVLRELFERIDIDRVEQEADDLIRLVKDTLVQLVDSLDKLNDPQGWLTIALADASSLFQVLETEVTSAQIGASAASFRDATDTLAEFSDLSQSLSVEANRVLSDLDRASAELTATLRAVRHLAEMLERDPGALLRGHESAPEGTP